MPQLEYSSLVEFVGLFAFGILITLESHSKVLAKNKEKESSALWSDWRSTGLTVLTDEG